LPIDELISSKRAQYSILSLFILALLFIGEVPQASEPEAMPPAPVETEEPDPSEPEGNGPGPSQRVCQPTADSDTPHIAGDLLLSPTLNRDNLAGEFYTLSAQDAMGLSLAFTQEVFRDCADHLVISEVVDVNQLAVAARLAAFRDGPLLVNVAETLPDNQAGAESDQSAQSSALPASPPAAADVDGADAGAADSTASPSDSPETASPETTSPDLVSFSPVHPEVLAEFRRLEPKGVTVIGSQETAQFFFELFLEADEEKPDVTLILAGGTEYITAAADILMTDDGSVSAARLTLPRLAGPATPVRLREAIVSEAVLKTTSASTSVEEGEIVAIDPLSDPAIMDPAGELAKTAKTVEGEGEGPIWLVASDQPVIAILAQPALASIGGDLLYVAPADLRGSPQASLDVLSRPVSSRSRAWQLVGPMPDDADWQLQVIATGQQLPGGGYLLFPNRRIVAMYGHTNTSVLGVLGEQSAEEGVERASQIAEGYDADGLPVVTAFEIIATLASSAPNYDNSYSLRTPVAELRPWIETAAEENMYVILDLQPGRTDFLTQAKEYEELLKLPHVGLALDPEWRLKPDQFHLRQVGSVDSSEVNQVIDWLADIVRENNLPQKLLMVHQFSFQMITNREDIKAPPELAVMIHMDGQGQTNLKFDTYAQLTTGALDNGWWWGWKNFYDEDIPRPLPPNRVLAVRPVPYVVSFQ